MTVRLDKWLWAARFFKTRSIAKQAIEGGKVHVESQRAKASKTVDIGMTVKVRQGYEEKTVVIEALSEQRKSAQESQKLYRETTESLEKRQTAHLQRKLMNSHAPIQGKPNKKQRRQIIQFKQKDS